VVGKQTWLMTKDDFFTKLLKSGSILKCESNASGWASVIKLDDEQYVLTITRCQDISDAWDYLVTDRFGEVFDSGQYTKVK